MKKTSKLAGVAMATLMAVSNSPVIAGEQASCASCDETASSGEAVGVAGDRALARQKLIDALKSMKNEPEKIEFHSAMCYKMAMPPATVDYTCPGCGNNTTHSYNSTAGEMVRQMASVRRALPNLPVKIALDETALCSKCRKGTQDELVFTSECGKCSASFTWKISNSNDLDQLGWLFLDYPVTVINDGPGRGPLKNPDKVKAMVEFVSGCTFCPKCIEELQLSYEKQP
ncbi:MAG: hypothetical protein A2W80_06805 [Candidatus Riflebacteria bacterium GWC2_50_8]|nr:MAG: hypothetical protein A2W80_06805 [Candidatus Riflebacteria bacterium GWC2_50_8]